jgi:aryl-phospho-beta-D-glucosidase BglC (GH1 family)
MAAQGINTVRLPIGYFSVGPWFTRNSPFAAYAPVYENTWRYIARSINWAAKYDIGVIVDLHGAYGSQNGQLHSGLSDGNIEFYNDYNMGLTTDLLVWLAAEISDVTNVVGIQLLNEPQDRTSLWPWYTKTMNAMRKASAAAATVPLYFHDAFNLNKGAAFVAKRQDFIVQDHHAYYVYTPADTSLSAKGHTKAISGAINANMNAQSKIARRNLIIGEWSCALNPNSLSKSTDRDGDQKRFCQAQADVYSTATAGWTFWSWKLEGCSNNGGWCFQQAAKQYLPSTYDSWGLQTITSALLKAASGTDAAAKKKVTTLLATIAAIPLPSAASLNLKALVNSDDDSKSGVLSIDESGSDDDDVATSTELPRIGKVVSTAAPETSTVNVESATKEGARVGMVVKSRSGSLAARAAAIVKSELAQLSRRQATSRSALASRAGYSDGFKTARYFAANGGLSRLGFAQQYMQDSWQARLATGKVDADDSAGYLSQFKAGLLAAETAIVKSIQSAALAPGCVEQAAVGVRCTTRVELIPLGLLP